MAPMSPETAVSPLQQAPPDRPSRNIEQWAREGIALLFGDNKLDMNERRILRGFFEEVALRAQSGGVGNGMTPPAQAAPPSSPMEMNMQTEDYGTVEGAEPMREEGY